MWREREEQIACSGNDWSIAEKSNKSFEKCNELLFIKIIMKKVILKKLKISFKSSFRSWI